MKLAQLPFLTALYVAEKNKAILTALPKKKSLVHPFFTRKNKPYAAIIKSDVRVIEFDNYRNTDIEVFKSSLT